MTRNWLFVILLLPKSVFAQPEHLTPLEFGPVHDFFLDEEMIIVLTSKGIYLKSLEPQIKDQTIHIDESIDKPSKIQKFDDQIYFSNKEDLHVIDLAENEKIFKLYTADSPISNFLVLDSKRIAIGTRRGELLLFDRVENQKIYSTQFTGLITCILVNPEEESLIISDIKGNLKSVDKNGELQWSKKLNTSIFDLHVSSKKMHIAGSRGIYQLNRQNFSIIDKYRTSSWVSSVSGNSDYAVHGTIAGKIEVWLAFANYHYQLKSSITKIVPLARLDNQIELIILTESGTLMQILGKEMKLKSY